MTKIIDDIQIALEEHNFPVSNHLLNHVLQKNLVSEIMEALERQYNESVHQTLQFRDHILYFLGMWDVYFAIQISSFDLFRELKHLDRREDVVPFMLEFVRNLQERNDLRFDQFSLNVEKISQSHYAVLLPRLLNQRMEELEECKIHHRTGTNPLYCTKNLLETYYGNRIVSAALDNRVFGTVVGEKDFKMIAESLTSAGVDVSAMLVEVDKESWSSIVCEIKETRETDYQSLELRELHRVFAARTEIFLDSFRKQVAALDTITSSKTHICNDILVNIASDSNHPMQRRAIKALGESGDSSILDYLSNLMNDSDKSVRIEAARAFSFLTSRSKWSAVTHRIPASSKAPPPDISKINQLLNTIIMRDMPSAIIDDTLIAIAAQSGKNAGEILKALLLKPQANVRMAVVKASRLLDRDIAASIIKSALEDESPEVVQLAEQEINRRWPDDVWH